MNELPVIAVTMNVLTQELDFHWFHPPKTTVKIEVLIDGTWTLGRGPIPNNSNTIRGLNHAVSLRPESGIPQVARAVVV